MRTSKIRLLKALPAVACLAFLASGPAWAGPKPVKQPAVYFPPAPELPRLQFLTSFSGRKDIEKQSSFERFVLGERPDLKIGKPYGTAIHAGKIYVCDTTASVVVIDLKARAFTTLKGAVGLGTLQQPTNISIDRDGTKYVADPVRGQVVVFNRQDEYVSAYGDKGSWRPVDAAPYEDRLYVVDTAHAIVKVLDKKSGELLKTIGDKGDPANRLDRPTNLSFDHEGYLYVTDFGRFQVLKFDRDGHFKAAFGKAGDNLGHFARPKGVAVDRQGRLYATDAAFNNVQIFNNDGRLLMFFGQAGERAGDFLLPAKVVIDYDNLSHFKKYLEPGFRAEYLVIVTSQVGERRVNVLAYGQQEGKSYPNDADLLKQVEERAKRESETPR